MNVIVIGAGVIGITTAYFLARKGCQVTVVDGSREVASGASHANAGQLSWSFTDSLASPRVLASIPAILAGREPGMQLSLTLSLFPWSARFLSQCTMRRAQRNTAGLLRIAMRSSELMHDLRAQAPFEFSYRGAGKLVLLANAGDVRNARASSQMKKDLGCEVHVIGKREALAIEPALGALQDEFEGAVFSENDDVADARLFSHGLRTWLENQGSVQFRMGQPIERIEVEHGLCRSVSTGDNRLVADAVVVCAGVHSESLLRPLGLKTNIYPVRGYSVTLPPGEFSPMVSVTSMQRRIVFSRINGDLRVAGFADFHGLSRHRDASRIANLLQAARECAPLAADYAATDNHGWGGFRPLTPDGQPRVGKTRINGLYVNTGHGMLGWTLACATAETVSNSITTTTH